MITVLYLRMRSIAESTLLLGQIPPNSRYGEYDVGHYWQPLARVPLAVSEGFQAGRRI